MCFACTETVEAWGDMNTCIGSSQPLGLLCRLWKSICKKKKKKDGSWITWGEFGVQEEPCRWQCQIWLETACFNNEVIFLPLSILVRLHCLIVYNLWLWVYTPGPFRCLCQGTCPFSLHPFWSWLLEFLWLVYILSLQLTFCFLWKRFLSPYTCSPVLAVIIFVLELLLPATEDRSLLWFLPLLIFLKDMSSQMLFWLLTLKLLKCYSWSSLSKSNKFTAFHWCQWGQHLTDQKAWTPSTTHSISSLTFSSIGPFSCSGQILALVWSLSLKIFLLFLV